MGRQSYKVSVVAVIADIENFTAWSSVREPGQVFSLLESIFGAFDSVAKRRGAYKVETIGDSVRNCEYEKSLLAAMQYLYSLALPFSSDQVRCGCRGTDSTS